MFCQNCGRQIPDNAKFCNHCGAAQGVQEDTLSQNTKQNGRSSAQTQQHIQQPYESNRKRAASASKLSMHDKIVATLVVGLMFAAAAGIAYWGDIFDRQPASDLQGNTVLQNTYQESREPQGLDEEKFPFYALLIDSKKVVYEEALTCIENGNDNFIPSSELSESAVRTILNYIHYDQPQLFWFDIHKCNFVIDSETEKVSKIMIGYNNLADNLEYNKKLVEDVTEEILSEATNLSDLEAERFFHDYICKNITYQSGAYDQNIYSAFVENKTVCAGYTRALQYLMMKRGVPCYYCVGTLYDVEEQDWLYHAWNIIKLNGNYYNCDLTWDDFYNEADKYPSYISYEHFNTSDAQYIVDGENTLGRLRTGDGILLPACNADDMNYKALYGTEWEYDVIEQLGLDGTYMIDSVDSYFDFLYTQAINRGIGNHSLTFIIKDSDTIEQIGNLSNDEYVYHLIDPVADYLGRSGWSGMNWQSQYYPLWPYDEYFYMEYQLDFY